MAHKLTARFIAAAAPGVYGDLHCPTLYLRVNRPSSNGRISRSWRQRLQIDRKQCWLGLGGYPVVGIDEARDAALENRRALRRGDDPRWRRRSSAPTFEEALSLVIEIHSGGWRNGRTEGNWRATLERYAYSRLGTKPVDRITAADVMAVLNPIWHDKPETAGKVRQRISTVMNWSVSKATGQITRQATQSTRHSQNAPPPGPLSRPSLRRSRGNGQEDH